MTNCLVCGGTGWMSAAPVRPGAHFSPASESARPAWSMAQRVPCWVCFPTNLKVMT